MTTSPTPVRIGIDLGGTKIEVIALDRGGQIRFRQRTPTPATNYQATLKAIAGLVEAAETGTASLVPPGTASIGIGIPGAISPATGLVKNANSTALIGHPLDRDLTKLLGRPVRVANDADCFTLSEAADGAGADADIVWGIILGTGVGGGLAIRKQLVSGPNAITGEWGHNPMPCPDEAANAGPKPECYCGRDGCVETWLQGMALTRDYQRETGQTLDAAEIAARADAGEAAAAAVLARYVDRLARATASVINIIDPHVVVLGGGLSKIARLYDEVPKLWTKYVFSDTVATKLRPPVHGDSSGSRGAAWLWP